ncbi:programmed cell death protein 4-like [Lingula anatina]|uniref:Programmed cell death protein 4 n=1 Tax=Lingula anatina TaxID=7574 RepID=A0A1S3H4B6_LINAN|nr:programmed cell death protein 4 [Lingula anatina]XP_013381029.1 programmed cell death protein 4-like [Lingula anatina]|eukprot:XP_013380848.1 programmed cell death protein 4 [Lingula anatina]
MEQPMENGEVENGNVLFSKDSMENDVPKEDRVIRKAKRLTKLSPRKDDPPVVNGNLPPVSVKNMRKSRMGLGRGLPKKGGAGGKGTWGAPGSELYETSETQDAHDPNYDSEKEEDIVVETVKPPIQENDLVQVVEPILKEYLECGDTEDVLSSLQEMNLGENAHKLPEMAVSLALDRKAHHRELTSILISDLYGNILSQDDVAKGFDQLLAGLTDLSLDAPDAPNVIGQFIARAVADDCLPPKYVASYKGKVDCPHARTALDKADVLLSMKHGIVRLDNVWGMGGGNRPVKYLIKKMVLLLKEYLSSGDIAEATRCLKELEVPHFNHELVYEATVMVIEDSSERAADMMVKLLKSLYETNIISIDQMKMGFKRIFENIADISIDVPSAYNLLDRFGTKLHAAGALPTSTYNEMPNRGRKRFVSEGDGGRIKEDPPLH